MIEINLLPVEFRKKEVKKLKLPPMPTLRYFMMAFAGLIVLEVLIFFLNIQKQGEIHVLEGKYESLRPHIQAMEKLKTETGTLQKKIKALRVMASRPFYWTQALNAISDEMADGIWLTDIRLREEIKKMDKSESDKKKKRGRYDPSEQEKELSLVLEGLADPKLGGTAAVAKFIQKLEENAVLEKAFERIGLEKIGRIQAGDNHVFQFSISCFFKKKIGERYRELR